MFLFPIIACQLEKAKKKEAAFVVTYAKREHEIADLKVCKLSSIACPEMAGYYCSLSNFHKMIICGLSFVLLITI